MYSIDPIPFHPRRQAFHYVPPAGWMNDPNGPIFHNGIWHLFFQHQEIKHWGHATSRDLTTWETLPIAIAPSDLGEIWSGSIIHDADNTSGLFSQLPGGFVAIFTLRTPSQQTQGIAYSANYGLTWTHYDANPVLSDPTAPNFRDPKVFWYEPDRTWRMVLAAGGEIRLYASPNLTAWRPLSRFGAGLFPDGTIFECPDLFELPVENYPPQKHWLLNVSVVLPEQAAVGSERHVMYHMTGKFDGQSFIPDGPPIRTTAGPDDYAAITFAGTGERRLWIGWMSNWAYAQHVLLGSARGGCMTLPRELTLVREHETFQLVQRPPNELKPFSTQINGQIDIPLAEGCHPLIDIETNAFELLLRVRLSNVKSVGVRIGSPDNAETEIGFDNESGLIWCERRIADKADPPPDFIGRWSTTAPPTDDSVIFHIFVDRASIEVFINDGRLYFPLLQFSIADHLPIKLFATEPGACLTHLEWRMRNQIGN